MSTSGSMTPYRWGALAFMVGSVLFLVNKLDEISARVFGRPMPDVISGDDTLLILIGQVVFSIGFVAFYLYYAPRTTRAGRVALGLVAAGGVLTMLGHITFMRVIERSGPIRGLFTQTGFDPFFIVILGGLLLLVGLIGLGVLNWRQPIMGRWRWLPLATAAAMLGFFMSGGEVVTVRLLFFRTLFALGLIGLGFVMWRDSGQPNVPEPVTAVPATV